jgi:endoglucanase
MNIAGFNLGIDAQGSHQLSEAKPPLTELGGADGAGQMKHFVEDDEFNVFRLPVTWQYLTGGKSGPTLDPEALGKYNQLVRTCLETGARCVVDLHNFGRVEGKVGPRVFSGELKHS